MLTNVLILEDDIQITLQWRDVLTKAGYEVFVTHGAKEALEVFSNNKIDLCIIDFMVREEGVPTANGGLSFLGLLDTKARKSTRILGVSGMTRGWPEVEAKTYLMTFGAEKFLAKPFTDNELLAEVSNMLN